MECRPSQRVYFKCFDNKFSAQMTDWGRASQRKLSGSEEDQGKGRGGARLCFGSSACPSLIHRELRSVIRGSEGAELSHFCCSDGGREGEKETRALLAFGDSKQLPSLRQSSEWRVPVVRAKHIEASSRGPTDMIQGSKGVWAELMASPTSVCHPLILSA